VLRLLTICPYAQVLARENPAAFFEMACHFDRFMSDYTLRSEMLRVLRGSQRALFALRGLPASESARRLFKRLPPADVSSSRLQTLGRALAHPRIGRWLPQLKFINALVADLLKDPAVWPYLTPHYVAELSPPTTGEDETGGDPVIYFNLRTDVALALERLRWFHRQVRKAALPFRTFKSSAELDNLPGLPNRLRVFGAPTRPEPFPQPPVPGTAEIAPITTHEQLMEEAALQQNCAGYSAHVISVLDGSAYFYRAIAPERCTVQIQKYTPDSGPPKWIITEIRTFQNGTPCGTTLQAVTDALGLPAAPIWHPADCWWSDDRRYVCVPKPSGHKIS
jgi:hypothetical protein